MVDLLELKLLRFQISDDTGEKHTFDEIRMMTIRAAQNLQRHGFKKGDMLAIMARDVPSLAPIAFGAICLGLPIMNMPEATKRIFENRAPKLLLCLAEDYEEMADMLTNLNVKPKIFTFDGVAGDSEAAEKLLDETGIEEDFS